MHRRTAALIALSLSLGLSACSTGATQRSTTTAVAVTTSTSTSFATATSTRSATASRTGSAATDTSTSATGGGMGSTSSGGGGATSEPSSGETSTSPTTGTAAAKKLAGRACSAWNVGYHKSTAQGHADRVRAHKLAAQAADLDPTWAKLESALKTIIDLPPTGLTDAQIETAQHAAVELVGACTVAGVPADTDVPNGN